MATFIVNAGLAIATARLKATGQAEPVQIGWGTGAGTTAKTDTTLFTEAANSVSSSVRVAGSSAQATTTVTNDTYRITGTVTAPAGGLTITNAGLFDNATIGAGNCFMKGDFTGIALNAGDSIAFTFNIVAASA